MFKINHNKKENGQGLVEYALILVLVAIVVIAVLMLLGPIIGGVFSTVNDSLSGVGGGGAIVIADPVPEVPAEWTTCANEGGYCSFSGTAPVRYGAGSTWVTGTHSNGVACDNTTWGDPIPGVGKICQVYQ
jgi:Flp pilus assembly pilin Flp